MRKEKINAMILIIHFITILSFLYKICILDQNTVIMLISLLHFILVR